MDLQAMRMRYRDPTPARPDRKRAQKPVAIHMDAKAATGFGSDPQLLLGGASRPFLLNGLHHQRAVDQVLADVGHGLWLQTRYINELASADAIDRSDEVKNEARLYRPEYV